ncbi:AraC family transcriptional regulator [Paenibacillus sp. N4]|uniref:AraC family transcriptional regulator n=1 Tax=Paenibacillus vietnamensis TaxID=2590547 RepID=UPI001CD159AB|nr:AraC family transcriptional regulator [Paenibacillus vietnamensis]MCA0755985.1 AraC family transcriptional regulator [Paenibacillus vietnamensis]
MIEYLPQSLHQSDLHLIQFGMEQCAPRHSFGPAMRDYYKIHYILEGEGRFEIGGKTYRLAKGQGFLISPGTITHYIADDDCPWKYCWIGFGGIKAATLLMQAGLSVEQPIFSSGDGRFFLESIEAMAGSRTMANGREIKLTGLLYLWLAMLVGSGPPEHRALKENMRDKYVAQVVHFIGLNYASRITVGAIAQMIGLQRSYLNSLFQDVMGCSIQQYLIAYRIRKAAELLVTTKLSVGDIARSVGYEDPLLFSKMFRKNMELSPSDYRSNGKE